MPFLPTLRGMLRPAAREGKAAGPYAFAAYYQALASYNGHTPATRAWPIERAIAEGYDRVMWVFKAVNTIAADSARLPYQLFDGTGDDASLIDDHPLYRLLNKKANPLETGQIFRKRLSAQILLSKTGAFVEVTKSNGGTPIRLDLLPPDRVQIIPDEEGNIDHYELTRRNGSVKNLDPEQVRWFRDPHPIDPYSGTTPLESMGMSIELDYFARLYNVAFMQNDGRPGGVLGVKDTKGGTSDIDPRQMDRIEQRFGKGPVEAGKLSVIAGDLAYVDLAARPRDMQYQATSRNSKIEILSGFGIGESVLGYAAERTFDNADNELYVYWTRTMPGHNEVLLTGFDEDSDDDLHGRFDTSGIEVLERHAKAKRAEAREEVGAGLRSLYSYAKLAGYDDEIEETPHTRALYIPTGKTPLPSRAEDAEALGLGTPVEPEGAPGELPPGAEGGAPALPPGEPPGPTGDTEALPPGRPQPPALTTGRENPAGAAAAALAAVAGTKRLRLVRGGGADPKVTEAKAPPVPADAVWIDSDPNLDVADRFEDAVAALLAGLAERWTDRALTRLGSPKQRKGTRHWAPEYDHDTRVGTKALDTARAVDEDTWAAEAEEGLSPLVEAAAVAAALALLTEFAVTPPPGYSLARMARDAVTGTVAGVLSMVTRSVVNAASALVADLNRADQADLAFEEILDVLRESQRRLTSSWARQMAVGVATATTAGARDGAAREANRDDNITIDRVWFSRRDTAVRPSHKLADGQTRALDEPFIVGESLLRFPHDPEAPIHETANCRCWLRHRARLTGRWVADPEAKSVRPLLSAAGMLLADFDARLHRDWDEPRDGDNDGFVYDGTPRMRPARHVSRADRGRPYAEVRAGRAKPAPVAARVKPAWDDSHVIRPDQPFNPTVTGDAVRLTRSLAALAADVVDWRTMATYRTILDALVDAARRYDEATDDALRAGALEDLLRLLPDVRDLRDGNGDRLLTEDRVGVDTLDLIERFASLSSTRDAKAVYTSVVGKTLHRGQPRDADGDGFIDDGKPTQRPAPVRVEPIRWQRHEWGQRSADRDWFLERGAPMAGASTNAWFVFRRADESIIGHSEHGSLYDTRNGDPLRELDGVIYAHEADAGSLAEARTVVAHLRGDTPPEPAIQDYRAAGRDAAVTKFGPYTPEQITTTLPAVQRAHDAAEGTQRDIYAGVLDYLHERLAAAQPEPEPTRLAQVAAGAAAAGTIAAGNTRPDGITIENLRKVDGFGAVYEGTVAEGSPPVWRHIGDRRELVEAAEAGWDDWDASKGGFTVRSMEGDTQFATTRDQALAWEHPQRRQASGYHLLVSADVSGLPVRFIGRTEADERYDMAKTFTDHGDGTGTFTPNTTAGMGVVGRIPLDRIRSIETFQPGRDGEPPTMTRAFASFENFRTWLLRGDLFGTQAEYEQWVDAGSPRDEHGNPITHAQAAEPEANPLFGQREALVEVPGHNASLTIMERLHGRRAGQSVDRVLWRVEKRDGVWGVYGPNEQVPASFQTGRRAEAIAWARDRANGVPDPDEE